MTQVGLTTCYYLHTYLPISNDSPGHHFPYFPIPTCCSVSKKFDIGMFERFPRVFPHFFQFCLLPPEILSDFYENWHVEYPALFHEKSFVRFRKFRIVKEIFDVRKKSENLKFDISTRVENGILFFFSSKTAYSRLSG